MDVLIWLPSSSGARGRSAAEITSFGRCVIRLHVDVGPAAGGRVSRFVRGLVLLVVRLPVGGDASMEAEVRDQSLVI
eukprot:2367470-Pyramimonas_sp.AAC.1